MKQLPLPCASVFMASSGALGQGKFRTMKGTAMTIRAKKPTRKTRCILNFDAWKERLQWWSGCWGIRSLNTGVFWANTKMQKLLGYPSETQKWEIALRWIKAADAIKIEDAHSRALKTGVEQEIIVQTRIDPYRLTPLKYHISRECCKACLNHCSMVKVSIDEPAPGL